MKIYENIFFMAFFKSVFFFWSKLEGLMHFYQPLTFAIFHFSIFLFLDKKKEEVKIVCKSISPKAYMCACFNPLAFFHSFG